MRIVSIDDLKEECINEFLTTKGLYQDKTGFSEYYLMTELTHNKILHMLESKSITIQEWIETQYQQVTVKFLNKEYNIDDFAELVHQSLESEEEDNNEPKETIDFAEQNGWQEEIDSRLKAEISVYIQNEIEEEKQRLNSLGYSF